MPRGRRLTDYSDHELEAFGRAIRATGGIENPLIVRPLSSSSDAEYELVTGGLRLATAHRIGSATVPCRVRILTAAAASILALIEDLAGKTERTLPLGWALLEGIEQTGWSQGDFATVINRTPSTISEAVRAARAVPERLLFEVATEQGVPLKLARTVSREDLRKIRVVRDPEARRKMLTHALVRLGHRAPVDGRNEAPPPPIILGGGGIRLDPSRIGSLGPFELLVTTLTTVWFITRTWAGSSRRFAGVRAAKSTPAGGLGSGASRQAAMRPLQEKGR